MPYHILYYTVVYYISLQTLILLHSPHQLLLNNFSPTVSPQQLLHNSFSQTASRRTAPHPQLLPNSCSKCDYASPGSWLLKFGNDSFHRCDRFCQIFVQIGAILAIFRPFEVDLTQVSNSIRRPFRSQLDVRFDLRFQMCWTSERRFHIPYDVAYPF